MATIHVASGQSIQTAINNAVAGDVITLAAGADFTGQHPVLKNKGVLASDITIRTDAADANLPAPGNRITAAYDAFLPILRSTQSGPFSNVPCITCEAGASNYKLIGLKFLSQYRGMGEIVALGVNESSQQFETQQPSHITIDRCRFQGDTKWGTHRGVAMNGKHLTVTCCDFDNIWSVGQDSQCIASFNGRGPLTITNNRMDGGTEAWLTGGSDPQDHTFAQVAASPAPTTTSARLTAFRSGHTIATLRVGQLIAVLVSGGTDRLHTIVRTINTSTNDITFDAIATAPDSGGSSDIRWGSVPDGITVERNYITQRLALRDGVIVAPTNLQGTPQAGTGSLAAGSHKYVVQAVILNGYEGNPHYSPPSSEVTVVLGATGQVNLTWNAVANAEEYRIYGRVTTKDRYWTSATNSFTDSGTAGTLASVQATTKPVVKNRGQLKSGTNVTIRYNVVENTWKSSDSGYFMWLKSVNQDGNAEFNQTKNVLIEYNIFRHGAGLFSIAATETYTGNAGKPASLEDLTIRHNLFYDSRVFWSDDGSGVRGFFVTGSPIDMEITHNTMIHNMNAPFYFDSFPFRGTTKIRNNLARRAEYGVLGSASSEGNTTLTAWNVTEFVGNVLAGGNAAIYPANNSFPTTGEFEAGFVDYDNGENGDYHLAEGSPFLTSGKNEDGTTTYSGADIATILSLTELTESGGAAPTPPPPADIVTFRLRWSRPSAVSGASAAYVLTASPGSVMIAGTAASLIHDEGGATDITWTNLINATATGNDIQKTGGLADTPNGAGISSEELTGDGYFEFTIPAIVFAQVGLSTDTGFAIENMAHSLRFQVDAVYSLRVPNNGNAYHGEFNYAAGDTFRITRTGTTITVTQNGVAKTPSPAFSSSTGTQKLDVSIWTLNGQVTDAKKG